MNTDESPRRRTRYSIGIAIDWFFFVFAGLAAIWLAYLSFTETFQVGWWGILFALAFWVLLAYLVLPRLHRIVTAIYVPDYFIGRARTRGVADLDVVDQRRRDRRQIGERGLRPVGVDRVDHQPRVRVATAPQHVERGADRRDAGQRCGLQVHPDAVPAPELA